MELANGGYLATWKLVEVWTPAIKTRRLAFDLGKNA
jgi:hypothetical protein